MEKRKAKAVQEQAGEGTMEGALEGDGEGAMEGVLEGDGKGAREGDDDASDVEIVREGFFKQPPRSQGTKTTKAEATLLAKRECTLEAQVRATEKMAIANLKAETLQDQAALSLFTMPGEDGLRDQAREYLTLCRNEEMERLKRHIDVKRHAMERQASDHESLMAERAREALRSTKAQAIDAMADIGIGNQQGTNGAVPSPAAPFPTVNMPGKI